MIGKEKAPLLETVGQNKNITVKLSLQNRSAFVKSTSLSLHPRPSSVNAIVMEEPNSTKGVACAVGSSPLERYHAKRGDGKPNPITERERLRAAHVSETSSKYHLPQVWADYLNGFNPWSWYGHFTFRDYPHEEQASKVWMLWTHKINRKLFGSHYWKHPQKGITWARATELQGRGAIHYHAILGRIPDDLKRFDWMDEWYKVGGIARIFPYEPDRGAEYYLSKGTYAWKRGEVDLGGPLGQTALTL